MFVPTEHLAYIVDCHIYRTEWSRNR